MVDFEHARAHMVETHIARRGVRSSLVLDAMRKVPREEFVDRSLRELAYDDAPLPIGEGQTISQPFAVAHMIDAAKVKPGDRVLEVGGGSGYAAAVLAEIVDQVFTVERLETLGKAASERLKSLGYDNVELRIGDGSKGWPECAPFDAIIVAAGGPAAPAALKQQLKVGGRLIIPVGEERRAQRLIRVVRKAADTFEEEDLGGVMFVPLVGEHGWSEKSALP